MVVQAMCRWCSRSMHSICRASVHFRQAGAAAQQPQRAAPTCMANLVVMDSRSDTMLAAALVYCRSTFCSARPRYCRHAGRGAGRQGQGARAGCLSRRQDFRGAQLGTQRSTSVIQSVLATVPSHPASRSCPPPAGPHLGARVARHFVERRKVDCLRHIVAAGDEQKALQAVHHAVTAGQAGRRAGRQAESAVCVCKER